MMNQASTTTSGKIAMAIDILRRQASLYERLASLAEKQRALVSSDDPQPLLKVLARRTQLTAELEGLSQQMAPLRAEWKSIRAAMTGSEGDQAEALIAQVNDRLQRLLASDEEDAQRLRAKRQRIGGDLGELRSAQQAVNAYRQADTSVARFERMHQES